MLESIDRKNVEVAHIPKVSNKAPRLLALVRVFGRHAFAALVMMQAVMVSAAPIDDLAPGNWYRVPSSKLNSVLPGVLVGGDFESIMSAWSGGTLDTRRDRLLIWGGGHSNYGGNEVYAFDIAAGSWARLSNPSTPDVASTCLYPDGKPRSRHTYGYLAYVPESDAMVSFGGSGPWPLGGGPFCRNLHAFLLGTNTWNTNFGPPVPDSGSMIAWAIRHPSTGDIWYRGGYAGSLMRYEPGAQRWTTYPASPYIEIDSSPAIDSKRNKLVAVGSYPGGRQLIVWDLNRPGDPPQRPTSSGPSDPELADAPGFDYDPVSDKFVAWIGGTAVYTLDPVTWAWQRVAAAGTNSADPGAPLLNGTFGRFRYVQSKNAFILANGINQDVFYYKLAAGAGTRVPVVSISAVNNSISYRGTASLTWSAVGADLCTGSGGWSGTKPLQGTLDVGPMTNTTTFTIACTSNGGSPTTASVTVTVAAPPTVSLALAAEPTSVASGGSSRISWSAANAESCLASGAWSGPRGLQGSESVGPVSSTQTYSLACTGAGGTMQKAVDISVLPPPAVTLQGPRTPVASGTSITLSWQSTNASSCTASGGWSGAKPTTGSTTIGPLTLPVALALSCTGPGGTAMQELNVAVTASAAPADSTATGPATTSAAATSEKSAGGGGSLGTIALAMLGFALAFRGLRGRPASPPALQAA
jgi:hypothetical protein